DSEEGEPMEGVQFAANFGLHPERAAPPEEVLRFAERAEELGYDALWVGDHIAFHSQYLDPLLTLAAFAGRTQRLTLGTAVYLLPLRHPVVVAKMAGSLDYLTGGRFIFGVGVGGEGKKEFEACGVPVGERGARADEAIGLLRKLWSGEPVSHEGRFFRFREVALRPPSARPGGPPIWVGGRSEAALRRAARAGDGWVSYLMTPRRFRESVEKIRALAAEKGRSLDGFTSSLLLFTYLHPDGDAAARAAAENLGQRYRMDFRPFVERVCALGPPERVAGRLAEWVEAGVRHFILKHVGPAAEEMEQLERVAEDVLAKGR
ncbi:MAG: LLM class flavin-dependent oxidoreductase, partial [Nitrospinota bacterium]